MFKRIFLFLGVNLLVIVMISFIINLLGVRPYLSSQGIDKNALLIFCLIWGMGGAFISLALSKSIAKWTMGVKIIDPSTIDRRMQHLVQTVHSLARKAGLREMPDVGIFTSSAPNAFATGMTRNSSLVAVSTGLLHQMNNDEVEGVLGHEIAHIANGDMVTMTLLQGVVNAFVMFLARIFAFAIMRNRRGGSSSFFGYFGLVILFEVVFMLLGSTLICAFSRWREFRADKGGADLAGKAKMISALEKLQMGQGASECTVEKQASFQALMINRGKKKGIMQLLFATHPPLEARITRLKTGL